MSNRFSEKRKTEYGQFSPKTVMSISHTKFFESLSPVKNKKGNLQTRIHEESSALEIVSPGRGIITPSLRLQSRN
jgi:hypothetical protein